MTVSMKKQIKTRWYVAALIAGMVVMCAIGFGIAMLGRNYMPRWLPVTIALLVTGPTVAAIGPRLARAAGIRVWAAAAIYAAVTGSIIFALVPGLNNFCTTAPAVVEATVVSKYTRQHTRYRRVSRRVRVPDGTYTSWHVTYELPDGHHYEESVGSDTYRRLRRGARRRVTLARGLFGYPVVTFSTPQEPDSLRQD